MAYHKKIAVALLLFANSVIWLALIVAVAVRVSPAAKSTAEGYVAARLEQSFGKNEKREYARAAKDTVGGATPQQTLQQYVDAVEAGNFSLASQYFVSNNQAAELKILKNMAESNRANIQSLLRQALQKPGAYSADKKQYFIREPIYVHLVVYPAGNWKIVEI